MAQGRKRFVVGVLLFATGFLIGWQGGKLLRTAEPARHAASPVPWDAEGPLTRMAVDAMVAILVVDAVIHRLRGR